MLHVWMRLYALLAPVSRTGNRLRAYVKVSNSHSSNPTPLQYSHSSQLANCLNPTTA